MYLYRHRRLVLKRFTRVLDGAVVQLWIRRDSYRLLGGLIAYESHSLCDDMDYSKVPEENRYKVAMMLAEARYGILARNWRTMVCRHEFLKIANTVNNEVEDEES